MENAFIINSSVGPFTLREALHQKTAQVRAITGCLLMLNHELPTDMLYHVLWAVDSYLEQIDQLHEAIDNISIRH